MGHGIGETLWGRVVTTPAVTLPRLAEEFTVRGLEVGTVGDHGIEARAA